MTDGSEKHDRFTALRKQAEALLKKRGASDSGWPLDFKRLPHELDTYQIELEIQNEELRLIQDELTATRDRFIDLYDFAPSGYLTCSPKSKILEANLTVADMLGVVRRKLIGNYLLQYVHKDDLDSFYLHYREALDSGLRQVFEVRLLPASGKTLWARLECLTEEGDGNGEAAAIRFSVSDISAVKVMQEELREHRDRLRAILASTADGLLVVDNKGKVIHANQQFARMWGIPEEVMRSGDDRKLLHNVLHQLNDGKSFLEKVRHLYSNEEEDFDTIFFKDGRIFERYSRPLVKNGELIGRVWSFRDITERKRTEAALAASELKFRTLFEQAAVGAAIVEAGTGRFLEVNPKFCDIVAFRCEELLERTFMDITYQDDLIADVAGMRRMEAGRQWSHSMEKRYVRKDGSTVWVALTAAPMWHQGEKPSTFVAIVKDITKRKLDQEKILYQSAVLEGINRISRDAPASETEEDLVRVCLKVMNEVTGSAFGFIGEIGADGLLHEIGCSDPGRETCRVSKKTGHRVYPGHFEIHGLYGKVLQSGAFFTNGPASHPASIGIPEGHPPIKSFLGAPLLDEGKTVGLVALANRQGGYREDDLRALESLANATLQALGRKRDERKLREYHENLEARVVERTTELFETNTALKVLLKRREADREEIGDTVVGNIKRLVEPCLERIRGGGLDSDQQGYLDLLAENLNTIVAPFAGSASLQSLQLTPTEIQVANMIRYGKSSKEIADLLHLSINTVNVHRRAIRKKLGISGKKESLQALLASSSPLD